MKLFLGLIFILLDVKITVGTAVIGILPDFVGYFLLMKGLEEREDPWRHLAFGLLLTGCVLFIADLVDKAAMAQVGFWCVELLSGIWMLVLVHRIVENQKGARELFPVVACMQMLTTLLGWIPLVGTVCGVANAVVTVCFLAAYWKNLKKCETAN